MNNRTQLVFDALLNRNIETEAIGKQFGFAAEPRPRQVNFTLEAAWRQDCCLKDYIPETSDQLTKHNHPLIEYCIFCKNSAVFIGRQSAIML